MHILSDLKKLLKRKKQEENAESTAAIRNEILPEPAAFEKTKSITDGDFELKAVPENKIKFDSDRLPDKRPKRAKNDFQVKSAGKIRRLKSDEEIYNAFLENTDTVSELELPEGRQIKPKIDTRKLEKNSSSTARTALPKTNRHGIPVLTDETDFERLMSDKTIRSLKKNRSVPPQSGSARLKSKKENSAASPKSQALNRNGLPLLDEDFEYRLYLLDRHSSTPPAPKSAITVDRHINSELKDPFESPLKEKRETPLLQLKNVQSNSGGHRLTMNQLIKRFPAPELELDLHGFTAMKADLRTESFIRSAFGRGLFTLRIIVGKGIHSEGRAVLPDVVEARMNDLKKKDIVLTYKWEKRVKAKSGSVVVYLNNRPGNTLHIRKP